MSWARDEWKQDLPRGALQKINELESEADNLRKNKTQQQFQLDSVSTILQKQKQMNTDEKATSANLRRDIQTLTRKCSELESQEENAQVDLKGKENKIELLEEQLRKAKVKLKTEEERNSTLVQELDRKQLETDANEVKIGKLSDDLEKAIGAKAQTTKEFDAAKEKIASLCKENELLRDQLRQRDEVLTKHAENSSIENEAVALENTADQETADAITNAFVEILKRENNALMSENEELSVQTEKLKNAMREKEKELERVMEKLAASHADGQKTLQALQVREKDAEKLKKELDRKEERIEQVQHQTELVEGKYKQLSNEIECDKRNAMRTEDNVASLEKLLEDAKNTIETLKTDLNQKENQLKAKRDRIESLEGENHQLTQELDSSKRQNNAAKESYVTLKKELRKRELRIKELEDEVKEMNKLLREQGEKIEVFMTENKRLKEDLELAQRNLTETKQSYRAVSRALEESRNGVTESRLDDTGQVLGGGHDGEDLERAGNEDKGKPGNKQKGEVKKLTHCRNCEELKAKLKEQAAHYESRIRELETSIRDLRSEKELLEQTVVRQRRSSEEFTSRVKEMVHNRMDRKTEARTQLLEAQNFVSIVNRFFTEHEGLKDQAVMCLRDLQNVQRYFQNCSDGAKDLISSAHAQSFQAVTERMSLLKSLLESVVDEFGLPMKMEEADGGLNSSQEDSPEGASSREDMSWDNYEREVAFPTFKGDVEDVLQELDKEKQKAGKKAEEMHEVKRAHLALKKVKRRSRRALQEEVPEEGRQETERGRHETERGRQESVSKGPEKEGVLMGQNNNEEFKDIMTCLLKENREELELRMNEQFSRLENTITRQRAVKNACPDERRQDRVSHNKEAMEGLYAIDELDMVKRKLSDVQLSMKHLIGSLAETETEKKNTESKISLLSEELGRKESQYETQYEDLTRAAKVASEQQIALRSRVDALASEKDDIHGELRRVAEDLKQKELELVAKSQQLRHLQSENKEDERVARNKIESLEQENEGLWMDYKEASKRAETKEMEFKELTDRLKCSQGYLHTLFNSLSNMDDELQRARDIEIYSAQD